MFWFNLSKSLLQLKNYEETLENLKKCIEVLSNLNQPKYLQDALIILAHTYYHLSQYTQSIDTYELILANNTPLLPSSKKYLIYTNIIKICMKTSNSLKMSLYLKSVETITSQGDDEIVLFNEIATIFIKYQQNYTDALNFYLKSLEIYQKLPKESQNLLILKLITIH